LKVKSNKIRESIVTHSDNETRELGYQLGKTLRKGDIVAFIGSLGSGKTCMIQGICRGIGFWGRVTSPSFLLLNEYDGPVTIYHMDLYRIGDIKELEQLGWEEYFYNTGICLIEWAEKAGALLPDKRINVFLSFVKNYPICREITIVR